MTPSGDLVPPPSLLELNTKVSTNLGMPVSHAETIIYLGFRTTSSCRLKGEVVETQLPEVARTSSPQDYTISWHKQTIELCTGLTIYGQFDRKGLLPRTTLKQPK